MRIDPDFVFSANSLQDYLDCPRRFELKYLLKQSWPAAMSEPVLEFEHHLQLGRQFHQLAFQYLNGVPEKNLAPTLEDADLKIWFKNLLDYLHKMDFQRTFAELPVRIPIKDFHIMAVFDLLAVSKAGELFILDWKTAERIPTRDRLADRVQTWLYPYAAFEASPAIFPDIEHSVDKLHMTYLFVQHDGDNTLTFDYTQELHRQNEKRLEKLIEEISQKDAGSFELTDEKRRCKYCNYYSLCERGLSAGDFRDEEREVDLDQVIQQIDFETQDEIAF
jgi:hypothetical protein